MSAPMFGAIIAGIASACAAYLHATPAPTSLRTVAIGVAAASVTLALSMR